MTVLSLHIAAESLRAAIHDASQGLVERETLVELVGLCAVAGEHLLVIGPPGTAKSEAVRQVAQRLGGKTFEYLLGRFTEPTEIFGPISLQKLKEGLVETETRGMLPEAELAFLDEVFLGSTAILNTLLTILNERTFRRGHTQVSCPLRVCVGASNALPEDPQLAAFADRFLARHFVASIGDSGLERLLAIGRTERAPAAVSSLAHVQVLADVATAMAMTSVHAAIAHAVRLLRNAGIALSDRRIVRSQRLVAAAAALAGRTAPTDADLWPLVYALPTEQAQHLGRDVLRDLLASSANSALLSAAAEGSLGPLARADRIVHTGTLVIDALPTNAADVPAWRLRLEGIAREIDASFPRNELPADLTSLRARIAETLSPATTASLPS
jgi:MoxR-like ATPase